jgi:hypothetical protein
MQEKEFVNVFGIIVNMVNSEGIKGA